MPSTVAEPVEVMIARLVKERDEARAALQGALESNGKLLERARVAEANCSGDERSCTACLATEEAAVDATDSLRSHIEELENRLAEEAERDIFADLADVAAEVHALARHKGWHDTPVELPAFIANLHGEVSELWEAYRSDDLNEPCAKASDMESRIGETLTCLEEEAADIIIRTLDMCAALGVDIARAVRVKHEFNETRGYRHGGKVA